jgi:hypothetical protein
MADKDAPVPPCDPVARAVEKQRSRDEDERQLAAGEITREELRRKYGAFSFPRVRVRICDAKKF